MLLESNRALSLERAWADLVWDRSLTSNLGVDLCWPVELEIFYCNYSNTTLEAIYMYIDMR